MPQLSPLIFHAKDSIDLALYLSGGMPQLPLASANGPGIICPFIFGALAPNSDSLNYISLRRIERAKAPERDSLPSNPLAEANGN
jgi:hypothetical protein